MLRHNGKGGKVIASNPSPHIRLLSDSNQLWNDLLYCIDIIKFQHIIKMFYCIILKILSICQYHIISTGQRTSRMHHEAVTALVQNTLPCRQQAGMQTSCFKSVHFTAHTGKVTASTLPFPTLRIFQTPEFSVKFGLFSKSNCEMAHFFLMN